MKKRIVSVILSFAIGVMMVVPAAATDELGVKYENERGMKVTESLVTKTVSADLGNGQTFVSSHDRLKNVTTIQLIEDGIILEETVIDHDKLLAQELEPQKAEASIAPQSDETDGAYKVEGENTFTDFEYEQWEYPNYNNGNGHFWFLRHPSDGERSVYDEDDASQYHDDLMTFKDGVETINTTEVAVGFSVALGVGSILTLGLTGTALLAALDAYLDSNDVPSSVGNVMEWKEAIESCQACWLRIFYEE